MFQYVLKRILIFIPTFLIIAWVTFMLSQVAPGDPVELMLGTQSTEGQLAEKLAQEKGYIELREKLGLHLPAFYFTLDNRATTDTLYRIAKKQHRHNLAELTHLYGNWTEISVYYHSIKAMEREVFSTIKTSSNGKGLRLIKQKLNAIHKTFEDHKVQILFGKMDEYVVVDSSFIAIQARYEMLKQAYHQMQETATPDLNYYPSIHWYGLKCQFHTWLFEPPRVCRLNRPGKS